MATLRNRARQHGKSIAAEVVSLLEQNVPARLVSSNRGENFSVTCNACGPGAPHLLVLFLRPKRWFARTGRGESATCWTTALYQGTASAVPQAG